MAGLQDFKDLESEIHEQIYNNLYLLSQFYPTSDNFKKVFKKDMFVKNNKAAFFEVIYYLLNALNPELTAQRLTSWPPYDVKLEVKFRLEVLNYISELNQIYECVKIPQIMASHLISPGGYKIALFVFKLSQLVMFEQLSKANDGLLYCPTAGEHTYNVQAINLVKQKSTIEEKIQTNLEGFDNHYKETLNTSQKVMDSLSAIDNELEKAQSTLKLAREEFNKDYPNYPVFQNLKEKLYTLTKKWLDIKKITETIATVVNLLNYLNSSNAVLEYNKDQLNVPNEILHIVKKGDELNLIELYEGLNFILGFKALEIPNVDHLCNDKNKNVLKDLYCQYLEIVHKGKTETLQLKAAINNLLEKIKLIEIVDNKIQENIYNTLL